MRTSSTRCTVSVALLLLTGPLETQAAMSEALYQSALEAAQKKAIRSNQHSLAAISGPILKSLFGRGYKTGDSWDVASWSFDHPMNAAKKSLSSKLNASSQINGQINGSLGAGGLFHYEVTSPGGPSQRAFIRITQNPTATLSERGLSPLKCIDPNVVEIKIGFTEQLIESEKTFYLSSPSGIAPSRVKSPLELLPLDVPDVITAEKHKADKLPVLPDELKSIAKQIHYDPDLKNSFWFEQDDFFGRPIQVLWEKGKPWPSYIKTPNGIALLAQSGAL